MAGNGNWGAHGAGSVDPAGYPQVLSPVFDPGFVPVSYGFRPGKSAHDAVKVARLVIEQGVSVGGRGLIWMRSLINQPRHSDIPGCAAGEETKRLLKLIRAYLEAGSGRWCASAGRGDPAGVTALAVALEHHAR